MKSFYLMNNTIMNYAWGSEDSFSRLFDTENRSKEPQAEIWMGAHHKASSSINVDGLNVSLDSFITNNPKETLGSTISTKYYGKLPFLFKVLAAGKPLSIQVHPTLEQAAEGFLRENSENISLSSPVRNYKDDNHKPELICALTPFYGMCGFRETSEIIKNFSIPELKDHAFVKEILKILGDEDSYKKLVLFLLTREKDVVEKTLLELLPIMEKLEDEFYRWVFKVSKHFPGDIGCLFPLILKLVKLQPGESFFMGAGEMHAYLEGTGLEIMASSDNVLRGGLTPKHIDVPELTKILKYIPATVSLAKEEQKGDETIINSPADEFQLSYIEGSDKASNVKDMNGPHIVFCLKGGFSLNNKKTKEVIKIEKGQSVFIPFLTGSYSVLGQGLLYKAAVQG